MDFATGALGVLLPKLAQLLQDEYNLQKGARKDIEFLSSELETMHAALRKVGGVPREQLDELQRIWARDVRELSYDMEDIVDTFMVRVDGAVPPSKRSAKRFIKKITNIVTKAMTRHEISQEIKDIKQRVKDVAERRDRYKVDAITPANRTPVDARISALYSNVTELVGIGEAKKEVITRLTEGDTAGQQKMIVSIAGFGGLGKTTLAKAVYDEIQGQFGCAAFVSVSRNPDIKKLLKDMLYEIDKEKFMKVNGANLDEIKHLIDLVREFLQERRYLIVIDDIWEIESWNAIGCALIENNMGSRIITTTRIIGVAEHVGGLYSLQPLSPKSSEILFYGRIFGSKENCPGQFSEVSKQLLKKCGGVPLAIVTTSSLLANKSTNIKEWYVVRDSIGLGLGSNPGMDAMRKILLLSYYDLPSHLKTCLLYLSIFPEDYEIEKGPLIMRWLAEGFVQGDQNFEIGESYFNELLNRSLIQPAVMDMEGTPHACRVHDMVLDLICSLSREESFLTTVLGDNGKYSSANKARRLSLHINTSSCNSLTMNMPKLRSLTIIKPEAVAIDPMLPSLSRCRLLRVLDLRGCQLKDLASLGFIGSLSQLRYLGLSTGFWGGPDKLPEEIGKLQFLQSLDLSQTKVEELPLSIVGLRGLICLRGTRGTRLPDGLKNLTSLQVLQSATVTSKCIAEELGHLAQLRVLKVWVCSPGDGYNDHLDDSHWRACANALVESLGKLSKIESLRLLDNSNRRLNFDGSMMEPLINLCQLCMLGATLVPTWLKPTSLPGLSYLEIEVTHERSEDIQVLGTLPGLRHLKFVVKEQVPELERSVVGPDAFPNAVRCEFVTEQGMVPSTFPRGAMPRLQDLSLLIVVDDFWKHTLDDLALTHLPSLKSVTVDLVGRDKAPLNTFLQMKKKLGDEAAAHPNHPRLRVNCIMRELEKLISRHLPSCIRSSLHPPSSTTDPDWEHRPSTTKDSLMHPDWETLFSRFPNQDECDNRD